MIYHITVSDMYFITEFNFICKHIIQDATAYYQA